MTRGKGIMGIFQQLGSFWYFFVVWEARVRGLVVLGATFETTGSLGGLNLVFHLNNLALFILQKNFLGLVFRCG
jgi:hypothetical protein